MRSTKIDKVERSPFVSPLAQVFHGRTLDIAQGRVNEFLIAYTVLYRRFQRVIRRFLTEYQNFTRGRDKEGWENDSRGNPNPLLDAYQDAVYVAFEIFDHYMKKLTPLVRVPHHDRRKFDKRVRELKREASIICNESKHNGAFLQLVEVNYDSGEHVLGFSFYRLKDHRLFICRDVYPNRGGCSFNWAIRRLVGALLEADVRAAELVPKARLAGSQVLTTSGFTLPLLPDLREIIELPSIAFPGESTAPIMRIENDRVFEVDWDAEKVSFGIGKATAFLDLLSHVQTVDLPYGGTGDIELTQNGGPAPPLTGEFRFVAGGIPVED